MSERETLQKIVLSSKRIVLSSQRLITTLPASSTPDSRLEVAIPPLCLSKLTSHLHSELRKRGLVPQICDLALSKATELALVHQHSYERVCERLVSSANNKAAMSTAQAIHNLRLTHEALYERRYLPQIIEDSLKAQATYQSKQAHRLSKPTQCRERRVFNHEYTPLLEKYFEYNAYPSAGDRLILSQKTMMTCRQIEVWFQNHRNRGKKEGRTLPRRKSNSLALDISLDSLETQIPPCAMSSHKRIEYDDNDPSSDESLSEEDRMTPMRSLSGDYFPASAPPHAFPTKYPPICIKDPFPNENGTFKFLRPTWGRRPATVTKRCFEHVDMDDFVAMFASKLSLREELPQKQNPRRPLGCSKSRQPWFTSIVTPLCPSPHPALIRVPSPVSSRPQRSISASSSSSSPFAAHQCISQVSHSLNPSWIPLEDAAKRQKLSPLPRRLPKNTLTTPQGPNSRTSSWSSVNSSQSRSTSPSSTPSTDPSTPPLSPANTSQELSFTPENLAFIREIFSSVHNPAPKDNVQWYSFSSREMFIEPFSLNLLPQATSAYLAAHS